MEKSKYSDNRLAEELDVIVLINNSHKECGLPSGSLGALTYSYTGRGRPLYGQFTTTDGEKREERLKLHDFRVLNENNLRDLSLIARYWQQTANASPKNQA
ncbi:MAG: hypothetical protein IJV85_00885 [Clostridia bacterium]|nr:hypothetical protein [Clostridia bacterium]